MEDLKEKEDKFVSDNSEVIFSLIEELSLISTAIYPHTYPDIQNSLDGVDFRGHEEEFYLIKGDKEFIANGAEFSMVLDQETRSENIKNRIILYSYFSFVQDQQDGIDVDLIFSFKEDEKVSVYLCKTCCSESEEENNEILKYFHVNLEDSHTHESAKKLLRKLVEKNRKLPILLVGKRY
jgi:hypothetical protein